MVRKPTLLGYNVTPRGFAVLTAMRRDKIEECVEHLCNKGCRAVRKDIAALERDQMLPEVWQLDLEERRAVLRELQAIMAVYGDSCKI
jgi:hypothetical protein